MPTFTSHASRMASSLPLIAGMALLHVSPAALAAAVSTPFGTISGDLTVHTELQSNDSGTDRTFALTAENVIVGAGGWSFSAPLNLQADYSVNGVNIGNNFIGRLQVGALPSLTALPETQWGEVNVTVEGSYATTGFGNIFLNPDFSQPGVASLKGTGTFSITKTLSELQASSSNTLLYWQGSYPYGYLSNGQVVTTSSVVFNVSSVRVSQAVMVPEPSSMALMALGLAGMVVIRRRT